MKHFNQILIILILVSCKNIVLKSNEEKLLDNPPDIDIDLGEEWTRVPANAGGVGLPYFFVMKYEAKAFDGTTVDATGSAVDASIHTPVSVPDNLPWRNINADDAAAECESLGAGYHLISNAEWMAIVRNAEVQNTNWTGGTVGTGCMFAGNTSHPTCGYSHGGIDQGSSRNPLAKVTLSNGQEVYDLAGNVWEWTDWDMNTAGFQIGPQTCTSGTGEIELFSCPDLVDIDYNTVNGSYNRNDHGTGRLYLGSGGAFIRGGDNGNGANAGLFSLSFQLGASATSATYGFRCVYRP